MNEEACGCIQCGFCCTEMEINILDLVHPDIFMKKKGYDFYKAHGLDEIRKTNGKVKILHRCQHLNGRNKCGIEGPNKPEFCVEWECRRHLRDSQWFKDRVGEIAVETIEKILLSLKSRGYQDTVMFLHEYEKERDALLKGGPINE